MIWPLGPRLASRVEICHLDRLKFLTAWRQPTWKTRLVWWPKKIRRYTRHMIRRSCLERMRFSTTSWFSWPFSLLTVGESSFLKQWWRNKRSLSWGSGVHLLIIRKGSKNWCHGNKTRLTKVGSKASSTSTARKMAAASNSPATKSRWGIGPATNWTQASSPWVRMARLWKLPIKTERNNEARFYFQLQ